MARKKLVDMTDRELEEATAQSEGNSATAVLKDAGTEDDDQGPMPVSGGNAGMNGVKGDSMPAKPVDRVSEQMRAGQKYEVESRAGRFALREIPLAEIDRSINHRIPQPGDDARLKDLMESIKAGGQLQPVRVYELQPLDNRREKKGFKYELGFGARRCEALERLGLPTVLAVVYPWPSGGRAEIESARAIENLHRKDIGPMEEVIAVAQLLKACEQASYIALNPDAKSDAHGHVAAKLGRSREWVKDRDYLHRLHPAVQELALKTQLPAGHLREIAKIGDPNDQLDLAIDASWSRDICIDTEASIKAGKVIVEDHKAFGKDAVAEMQEAVAKWEKRTAEGSHHRMTLTELQKAVQTRTRPLSMVPWEMSLPVIVVIKKDKNGKHERTLPACSGCPHNSETDLVLFGADADPKGKGFCANAGCYQAKQEASEQIKADLRKLANRKEMPPADDIRDKKPSWFRDSTATGLVRREWERAHPEKANTTNGNPKTARHSGVGSTYGNRKLTPHEKALETFLGDVHKWQDKAESLVLEALRDKPEIWAGYCALTYTEAFGDDDGYTWKIPTGSSYDSQATTANPTPPRPIDKALERLIVAVEKCDFKTIAQAEPAEFLHGGNLRPVALIVRMAQVAGVDLGEPPHWKDYAIDKKPVAADADLVPLKDAMGTKKKTSKKTGRRTS